MTPLLRPVWAEIDLGAVTDNVRTLVELTAPAKFCAVVKAQAYGHGPVRVAEAALAGGASWLAVALVEEGVALRNAGITEPVLVLSQPAGGALGEVVRHRITPSLYTHAAVEAAAKAVAALDADNPLPVHVKVDTGMHRVGAAPADAVDLAAAVTTHPELRLEGVWTHFAVADEPGNPFTDRQLDVYRSVLTALEGRGIRPVLRHTCNSAAALSRPDARFDLVRCGIAMYGLAPSPELAGLAPLRPALTLKARVAYVKRVAAGERVSYGLRYAVDADSTIVTVPIGYADGVPRRLSENGGEVLIRGRRHRIAGTVTMDQLMVDCGDHPVEVGDEVVLIGAQGRERIDAWEWADRLGTIAYEVVCGISNRVPRTWK